MSRFFLLLTAAFSFASAQNETCQVCPNNTEMAYGDYPISSNLLSSLGFGLPVSNCSDIDSYLAQVPAGDTCTSALALFSKIFDAAYYCGCPGAESPGVCSLCETVTNVDGVITDGNYENFTCPEANRFIEAYETRAFCRSSDLGVLCCPAEEPAQFYNGTNGTLIPGATPSPDDAIMNGTDMPDMDMNASGMPEPDSGSTPSPASESSTMMPSLTPVLGGVGGSNNNSSTNNSSNRNITNNGTKTSAATLSFATMFSLIKTVTALACALLL